MFLIDDQKIVPLKTKLMKKSIANRDKILNESSASYKEKLIAKAKQFSLSFAKGIQKGHKKIISDIHNSMNVSKHSKNSKSVMLANSTNPTYTTIQYGT